MRRRGDLPRAAEPRTRPGRIPHSPDDEVAWVRGLAFAGDSLLVAMGGGPVHQDEVVGLRLWEAASGQQLILLAGHAGGINTVAFTHDDPLVASAGRDGW